MLFETVFMVEYCIINFDTDDVVHKLSNIKPLKVDETTSVQ